LNATVCVDCELPSWLLGFALYRLELTERVMINVVVMAGDFSFSLKAGFGFENCIVGRGIQNGNQTKYRLYGGN
jgi:hypothetical protein